MKRRWIFIVPAAVVGMALFTWLGGELVMHLWNWLMPALFGLREVTFWQAIGLLALCRILFGGLGIGGNARSRAGRRMAERWESMTPEEREKFRKSFRGRCGPFEPPTAEPGV